MERTIVMARGKYASTAEARRVREGALSEVEAGRKKIAQLESESADLKAALTALRDSHAEDMRRMRALLAEGAAPEVAALEARLGEELQKQGERLGALRGKEKYFRAALRNLSNQVTAHLINEHGASKFAALQQVRSWRNVDTDEMVKSFDAKAVEQDVAVLELAWSKKR